jgi:phosphoglycerate dehydrogenase-like enzyme
MLRLLIHERTYHRVRPLLSELTGVESLAIDDQGLVRIDGGDRAPPDAAPDVAWLSVDLFLAPVRPAFFKMLFDAPALRWVQGFGAGMDLPEYAKLYAKGVRLTSSHGHAVSIGEYVLAGVLDHFQHGPARREAQAGRIWQPIFFREMMGTHWLIVGFGAIGQNVAARARAFGTKITAIRRDCSAHPSADLVAPLSELQSLLPQADVVVLSLPLNAATRHIVDAAFLNAMRAAAVFVNVGRGGLVDETALLAALDAGKPEHAILDVFETEPLPKESRFWSHPRVALTPHGASATRNLYPRGDALFVENLRRFIAGQPLLHEAKAQDLDATSLK